MKTFAGIISLATVMFAGEAAVIAQDSVSVDNIEDEEVYHLKPSVDVPIIAAAGGWSYYALSKIYKKDSSSAGDVLNLNRSNINGLDRWASYVYYPDAEAPSDKLFHGAMPLPLVLLFDKRIRKDALKIAVLYTEALSVTGSLYTSATYFNRYRPSTYSNAFTIDQKRSGNQMNSFFAGHVALVATSTFFTAKVFSDYHPKSKLKWVFYGAAIGATGATGYLRHRAGKHFPTDIIMGMTIGTLSGILVPQAHKRKNTDKKKLFVYPFAGESNGVAVIYKFR